MSSIVNQIKHLTATSRTKIIAAKVALKNGDTEGFSRIVDSLSNTPAVLAIRNSLETVSGKLDELEEWFDQNLQHLPIIKQLVSGLVVVAAGAILFKVSAGLAAIACVLAIFAGILIAFDAMDEMIAIGANNAGLLDAVL